MGIKRKRHSAVFKAKIALEAHKGEQTVAELISQYKVSSGHIKRQLFFPVSDTPLKQFRAQKIVA